MWPASWRRLLFRSIASYPAAQEIVGWKSLALIYRVQRQRRRRQRRWRLQRRKLTTANRPKESPMSSARPGKAPAEQRRLSLIISLAAERANYSAGAANEELVAG